MNVKIIQNRFFIGLVSSAFALNAYSAPLNSENIDGQLYGKIIAPEGSDLSAITIQLIGANQKDAFQYYTVPNENGEFSFTNLLPAGSLVQLYIWDGQGVLERTIVSAYVSPMSEKEIGVYEVVMNDTQFTQNLSYVYNTNHDFTRTGLCGSLLKDKNVPRVHKVLVYDRMAKSFGPLLEQDLDEKNTFCTFNLKSPSGSDFYDFVIVDENNLTHTFSYYLPQTTFVHNASLDMHSALYRPLQSYFWQDATISSQDTKWADLSSVNIATSDDYSYAYYEKNNLQNNLFYFPLANEVIEVGYFVPGENEGRFFTLIPRTQLVTEKNANLTNSVSDDHIYADYSHPYPIKLTTEYELLRTNSSLYSQTFTGEFGSVFVDLDLSQLNVHDKTNIQLSLRNIAGQNVGRFEELFVSHQESYSGFFLDLLPGRYQLFVQNQNGDLLWTYEVRSYQNRVQVLTNEWEQSQIHSQELANEIFTAQKEKYSSVFYEQNIIELNEPKEDLDYLYEEQMMIQNNNLYSYKISDLCNKIEPKGYLEKMSNLELPL